MRVISNTRWTSIEPRTSTSWRSNSSSRSRAIRSARRPCGVEELQAAQVDGHHVDVRQVGDALELGLEIAAREHVELARAASTYATAPVRRSRTRTSTSGASLNRARDGEPEAMARLRRADCSGPGITRRKAGRGFAYYDNEGERVDEPRGARADPRARHPARVEGRVDLPVSNGHLQATGIDAAGRKQYRYHDAWRKRRDAEKFEDMTRFARALPRLRERVEQDLAASEELSRERVLACAVRLLDRGFFRIGTEEYSESFGLATMLKEHVPSPTTGRWSSTSRPRAASSASRPSSTRWRRTSSARSSAAAAAGRSCWPTRPGARGTTCAPTTSTPT